MNDSLHMVHHQRIPTPDHLPPNSKCSHDRIRIMQQSAPESETIVPINWLGDFELPNTSGYSCLYLPPSCQPVSWNNDSQITPASTSHQAQFETLLQPSTIPFDDTAYISSQAGADLCRTPMCQYIGENMEKSALLSDQSKSYSIHSNSEYYPKAFECCWEGCKNRDGFSTEAVLIRHIKSIHISPGRFKCSYRNCEKTFGRKDKLRAHMKLVHL